MVERREPSFPRRAKELPLQPSPRSKNLTKIPLLEWWPACLVAWPPQSGNCLHWWEQDPGTAGWWLADQFLHAGICQGSWVGGQPIGEVSQWPNGPSYPGDQRSSYWSYRVCGLLGADRGNTQLQWGTSRPSSRQRVCFCQKGTNYSRNPDVASHCQLYERVRDGEGTSQMGKHALGLRGAQSTLLTLS